MSETIVPVEVSGFDYAFGGDMEKLLPKMEDIPDEFKQFNGTKWNKIVNDWFFCGIELVNVIPKKRIDKGKAIAHIKSILTSFEPSTEHKEAGVAYLLSLWFDEFEYRKRG